MLLNLSAHTQASSWHSKPLSSWLSGSANARAEITALSVITGGSSKCYLYSLSGECEGLWRSVWERAHVCWPRVKNKRFLIESSPPGAGCWKLWPVIGCWQSLRSAHCACTGLGREHLWSTVSLGSHQANNVFVCGSRSARLTGSKCRSFIACLFWLQIAGKGGKGGATTAMGPWTFCSLLSPRLRCSVLDEREDTSLSKC